jgi:hypothetical protein
MVYLNGILGLDDINFFFHRNSKNNNHRYLNFFVYYKRILWILFLNTNTFDYLSFEGLQKTNYTT